MATYSLDELPSYERLHNVLNSVGVYLLPLNTGFQHWILVIIVRTTMNQNDDSVVIIQDSKASSSSNDAVFLKIQNWLLSSKYPNLNHEEKKNKVIHKKINPSKYMYFQEELLMCFVFTYMIFFIRKEMVQIDNHNCGFFVILHVGICLMLLKNNLEDIVEAFPGSYAKLVMNDSNEHAGVCSKDFVELYKSYPTHTVSDAKRYVDLMRKWLSALFFRCEVKENNNDLFLLSVIPKEKMEDSK